MFLCGYVVHGFDMRIVYLFFKKNESMHSIAMNTLNACPNTKTTNQELHQVQEHSDLHQSIQCFD